jgi:hypothetical protein
MAEDRYLFSRVVLEFDRFYAEAVLFLEQFAVSPDVFAQLLRYQRESILLPDATEKILTFDYDFMAYFNAIYDNNPISLQKRPRCLRFFSTFDISSLENFYDSIVMRGRFSDDAFYKIESYA